MKKSISILIMFFTFLIGLNYSYAQTRVRVILKNEDEVVGECKGYTKDGKKLIVIVNNKRHIIDKEDIKKMVPYNVREVVPKKKKKAKKKTSEDNKKVKKKKTKKSAGKKKIKKKGLELGEGIFKYFPLKKGYTWVYSYLDGTEKIFVESEKKLNKTKAFKIVHTSNQIGAVRRISEYKMVYNNVLGIIVICNSKKEVYLKAPKKIAGKWNSWCIKGKDGDVKKTYISDKAVVIIADKKYKNCLKLRVENLKYKIVSYHYFAPGVGLVKIEIDGDEKFDFILNKFESPKDKSVK